MASAAACLSPDIEFGWLGVKSLGGQQELAGDVIAELLDPVFG